MSLVNGKNVRLLIYDNSRYRLYACATSCSISISTSVVETSVTGSGQWASFMPQKHGWSGTLDGVVNLDDPDNLTLEELIGLQIAKTKIVVRFENIDEAGNQNALGGEAYIIASSSTGDVNNVSTFSVEIQGTGALIQS